MTLEDSVDQAKILPKESPAKLYSKEPVTPVRDKWSNDTITQPLQERTSKLDNVNKQWNSEPRVKKGFRKDGPQPIETYFQSIPTKYHAFGNNRSKLANLRVMAETLLARALHIPLPSSAQLMAGQATEPVIQDSTRMETCSKLFSEMVVLLYLKDSTLSKSITIVPRSRHSSQSPPLIAESSGENDGIANVPRLGGCKYKSSILLDKIRAAKGKPPSPGQFSTGVHTLWASFLSILVRNDRSTLYMVLAEAASRVFDDWASDEKIALSCLCYVHICRSMLVYGIKTSPESVLACLEDFNKLFYSDSGVLSGPLIFLDTHNLDIDGPHSHHDDIYGAECDVLVSTQDINDFISDIPSSSLPSTDFGNTPKRRNSGSVDDLRKRFKPQSFSFADDLKSICRFYDWTFDLIDCAAFRLSSHIICDIKLSASFELLPHNAFPEARMEKALIDTIRSTEDASEKSSCTDILGSLFPGSRATYDWYLRQTEKVSAAVALAIQLASGLSIEEISRMDVSDVVAKSSKDVSLCGVRLPWVASEALLRYIAFIKPMQYYCALNSTAYRHVALQTRHVLFATIGAQDARISRNKILGNVFGPLETTFNAAQTPVAVIKEQFHSPRNKWLTSHDWAMVNVALYNYTLEGTSIVDLPMESE